MKKICLILSLLLSINVFSQTDSTKKEIIPYISASLSTSTGGCFKVNSYYGLEAGIGIKNLAFGLAGGRGSFDYSSENISNYWYELKSYVSFPVGSVRGFAVGGWGQYFNTGHSFLEYGVGAAYNVGRFDLSMTVSNWDNTVYLSPGICFNFNSIKLK